MHARRTRTAFVLLAAALVTSRATLGAQALTGTAKWADSARREIDAATRTSDDDRLLGSIALLDRALTVTPNDPLLLHYKGYALYRRATMHLGREMKDQAKQELEAADQALDISTKGLAMPESFALRSSITGQLIGLSGNPMAGMTLGPRASGYMDRALELGPNNPRVWLMHGMSAMFTPKAFGGGLDKAEERLRKAVAFAAADHPAPPAPSWGLADAYAWLGQVLERENKLDEAKAAYRKALEVWPDYGYAKMLLAKAEGGGR